MTVSVRSAASVLLPALLLPLLPSSAARADAVCEWKGLVPEAESPAERCLGADRPSPAVTLPANTVRLRRDGLAICADAWHPAPRSVDAIFLMDNSGSMENGETSGGFNLPPGDPFGVRDRMVRHALRQLRATADTATAGFISFFGLGPNQDYLDEPELETRKLQPPLDISRGRDGGAANLETVLRKVWKRSPDEALRKSAAAPAREAKAALTFWSEALGRARDWLRPESAFARTSRHALVLVSDGGIGDWQDVERLIPDLPPVHGIHLGTRSASANLDSLAALTGGTLQVVAPADTAAFRLAMEAVVRTLSGAPAPAPATVELDAGGMTRAVTAAALAVDPAGSLRLALPEDPTLSPGPNVLTVAFGGSRLALSLSVAGPDASGEDARFACAEASGLARRAGPRPHPGASGAGKPMRDVSGRVRTAGAGARPPAPRLFAAE